MHCWKSFTTKAAILLLSLTSCLEGGAQTRAVVYATNDFHLSPTNLLISNLLQGSNIVVQYTNLGKIWLHGPSATDTNGLATTNYVQDATNTLKGDLLWLEQFGSANLTNWGLLPTNTFDWKYQPGIANLSNWSAFATNILGDITNNTAFARTNIDNTFIGSNMFAGPLNGGTNVLIGPAYPLFANSGNVLTVNSNTLLVTSNRVGISTNAPGCTLDINAPYGANVQFQVCTGGVPVLVASNGYVGIRTASPTRPLDVNGAVNVNGNIDSYPVGNITAAQNLSAGGGYKIQIVNGVAIDSPALSYMRIKDYVYGTNGCALIFPSGTNVLTIHETTTNTVIGSQGTNFWIGDGITANGTYGQFTQFSFQTSGTPVMVISNGMVGIGKANPTVPLDVVGGVASSGSVQASLNLVCSGTIRAGNGNVMYWNSVNGPGLLNTRGNLDIRSYDGIDARTNGIISPWLIVPISPSTDIPNFDVSTNTVVYSQGTNLVISDGIQANSTYGQFNQFTFSTSGTPVMVISNGMVGIGKGNPTATIDLIGSVNASGNISAGAWLTCGSTFGAYIYQRAEIKSPARSYLTFWDQTYETNGCALIFPASTNVLSTHETPTNTVIGSQGTNLVISDSISPIGGVVYQGKQSFYTNYTITTNDLQIFNCNGTGQVVTLPNAGSYPWNIFRFSSTNGYGNFTLTNATGTQTIRDGTNLFLKNIGVGQISLYSDGAAWWLASKAKTIFPNASWSTSTNIICTADIITNIGYNTLEFNNSQGIALVDPSKIYITNFGQYLFTYSAVVNGGGNNTSISIWLRQSGVDVVRSRTRQVFTSATAQQCMTVNYIVDVRTNNTYYELVAASHDTGAGIISEAANPTGYTAPAMPGIIVTVNRISDSYP